MAGGGGASARHRSPGPERPRLAWLDIAKALGIYLIVFGHLPIGSVVVHDVLWTFHVPLFFVLSGYVSRPLAGRSLARRIGLRLTVPYILSYGLLTLIETRTLDPHVLWPVLQGAFWGSHSYPGFVWAPLWFLPALALVELFHFALIRGSWALYPLMLATSLWLFYSGRIDQFMSVDLALLGLNYFLLGVAARSTGIVARIGRPWIWVSVAAAGLALTVGFGLAGNVWYTGSSYMRSMLGGVAGTAMLVALALGVQRYALFDNRAVRFLSENTLAILCFHGVSNGYAWTMVDRLGIGSVLVRAALASALSILMLVPFILLVRRYAPWALGIARERHAHPASSAAL